MDRTFIQTALVIAIAVSFTSCTQYSFNSNESLYKRAQYLMDNYTGDREELKSAEELLERIAERDQQSEYYFVGLGRLTYKKGYINYTNYTKPSLEKAKMLFLKAIVINPNFIDGYIYDAYAHFVTKDLRMAKKIIQAASKINPESAEVFIIKSYISKEEENYEDAIKYATLAISKKPKVKTLHDAYSTLSSIYAFQGHYDLADNFNQKILKLKPHSPWVRVNYCSFLMDRMKDYDGAINQCEAAIKLMDFSMGRYKLGEAYYLKAKQLEWEEKDHKDSDKYFLLSTQYDPTRANAFYGLGVSSYRRAFKSRDKQMAEKAVQALEKAIELDPGHQGAIKYLKSIKKS